MNITGIDYIKPMYKITKQDDLRRITDWLKDYELKWLSDRKAFIEKRSGHDVLICSRINQENEKELALFYSDGYYDSEKSGEWVQVKSADEKINTFK